MTVSDVNNNIVIIRPMRLADISQIVQVHLAGFPDFFLTFLGPEFLTLLYQGILFDPLGVVLVASRDENIEGFVAGVMRQSAFYQRLIKNNKWSFARATIKALVTQPSIAPRLLRALRRPVETGEALAEACLMSIAVRPESTSRGIGKQLVHAFCQELKMRGAPAICLTTDRLDNPIANHFYQKLGFELGRTHVTPEGRAFNEYVIYLTEKTAR